MTGPLCGSGKPTDADTVSLHGEIRGYVSKLKDNMARTSFVMQAIADQDLTVARLPGQKAGLAFRVKPDRAFRAS
jgi:hypothetical protein